MGKRSPKRYDNPDNFNGFNDMRGLKFKDHMCPIAGRKKRRYVSQQ